MGAAILAVSAVAALAAIAAVAVPLWQQRSRLRMRFTGWSTSRDAINFSFVVENTGTAPIFQIALDAPRDGEEVGRGGLNTIGVLQPGVAVEFGVARRQPDEVEIAAGELAPTLKMPLHVFATYGRHVLRLTHPAGAFDSGAAVVSRERS